MSESCNVFQWDSDSLTHCRDCDRPYWEHDYEPNLTLGSPDVPITGEKKGAARARWNDGN